MINTLLSLRRFLRFPRPLRVIFAGLAVYFVTSMVILPVQVQAIVINSSGIPAAQQSHANSDRWRCRLNSSSPTHGHGETHWISRLNDSTNISPVVISQGTNSVNLQFNVLGNNCTSNMSIAGSPQSVTSPPSGGSYVTNRAIQRSRWNVVSANSTPGTSVSGLPATLDIVWSNTYASPATSDRYYVKSSSATGSSPVNADFVLSGLADLAPGTYDINVTITSRVVNRYHVDDPSGTHVCVTGGPTTSLSGPGCGNAAASATMRLVVQQDSGQCIVSAPATVDPGTTFPATFQVRNTGAVNWPTADHPARVTTSNRYQLGSGNTPATWNNTTFDPTTYDGTPWASTNRVELPGDDTGFGPIIFMNSQTPPWTEWHVWNNRFRAPATPGTYNFSWHLVQRTVKHFSGGCATTIIVGTIPPPPPPPAAVTCSPSSQTLDVGQSTTLTAGGGDGSFTWSAPGGSPGSGSGSTFSVSYAGSGNYTVTATSAGLSGSCNIVVLSKPYVRVYGGDVHAGSGFGSCTPNAAAKILAFSRGSSGGYAGAGTQLAASAANQISGFASAISRTNPGVPKGLTFANTSATGEYGGSWSGSSCASEFYTPTAVTAGTTVTVSNAMANSSTYNGNVEINGGTLNAGSRKTLYINGNAFINSSIFYAAGSYSASQIPLMRIVVNGNLYISANVSELNGIYVARPSGGAGTGKLYSCAFNSAGIFRPPAIVGSTSSEMVDSTTGCGRKLTVYGALLAQTLKLLRTNGTTSSAAAGEPYTSANQAETIIYTPQVWLTSPDIDTDYDAITGLPPVL